MDDISKSLKQKVRSHWEEETCGTRYGSSQSREEYFEQISKIRYRLEPYIVDFANFQQAKGKHVLEIGVGAGSDFYNWMIHGANATGVDLTEQAITLTRERLEIHHVSPKNYELRIADAENLPFDDNRFDIVYRYSG